MSVQSQLVSFIQKQNGIQRNTGLLFENVNSHCTYSIKTKILSMLGTVYFLTIAKINSQREKPICPNGKNYFPQNKKHANPQKYTPKKISCHTVFPMSVSENLLRKKRCAMSKRPKVNAISFLINKCLWMNLNSIRDRVSVAHRRYCLPENRAKNSIRDKFSRKYKRKTKIN